MCVSKQKEPKHKPKNSLRNTKKNIALKFLEEVRILKPHDIVAEC